MKKINLRTITVPDHIRYLFCVYLTGLVIFTSLRVIILIKNIERLNTQAGENIGSLLQAFWIGFRFDSVISGYLLILPFLLLSVFTIFQLKKQVLFLLVNVYILAVYTFTFAIGTLDIPYFDHFFSRFSCAALNWADEAGFIWKMIFADFKYWIFFALFLIITVIFILAVTRHYKKFLKQEASKSNRRFRLTIVSIFCLLLLIIAMRGRTTIKSPIRTGTAYFSNNPFLNQLGLNPVFTFVRSWLDSTKQGSADILSIKSGTALQNVQGYLRITEKHPFSPVARKITFTGAADRKNVVLVVMEAMSFDKTGLGIKNNSLTPNLDRISRKGYSFTRVYTSGTHTYNGLYSTLFGFPTLLGHNPLKSVPILKYHGLPTVLKNNGYQTVYFTTHDDQFDNVGGFFRANDFEKIFSEQDYPPDKVLSTLGVPDDYLFEYSIPVLNRLHGQKKPFLAVFMTASDHRPYIIPENIPFTPRSEPKHHQIVEYADWSISKFLKLAAREEWYDNTVFAFIADHGSYFTSPYDMPLSYFHTPFIIYAPKMITQPKTFDKIGSQMDVFPTLMGLLRIPYLNNTLGVDLIREDRPFTIFTGDDKFGCLGKDYFLVIRKNKIESLYRYTEQDPANYLEQKPEIVSRMKEYTFSLFKTMEWMLKKNLVGRVRISGDPLKPGK